MRYLFPSSVEEALQALGAGGSAAHQAVRLIAGGTDLAVQMADGAQRPDTLVDLSRIEALCGIEGGPEGLRIGALTTIARIAASAGLPACLVQGARSIGAPQVRSLATIGGNICNASPCGDTLAPLVALEAVFLLVSPRGQREVAAEAFFRGPKETVLDRDEILTEVRIGAGALQGRSAFRSIGRRAGQAISQVNLALWALPEGGPGRRSPEPPGPGRRDPREPLDRGEARLADLRLAAGSVAPVPLRLVETEGLLRGRELSPELLAEAGERLAAEIRPISDVRATDAYRREVIRGLFGELVEEILGAAS